MTPPAIADSHYVSNSNGVDSGNCTDRDAPCKTLRYGLQRMNSGDTLEIGPGIYSGSSNSLDTYNDSNFIPNGTTNAYTTIRASQEGTVEISAPFNLGTDSSYLQIEGLKLSNTSTTKGLSGHHIKILKTAIVGGPSTNNEMAFSIGTNDTAPGAHHILLQDVWAYGLGGRYNILIYNSENVVVRRAVARHDGGWSTDCSNPEAGVTIYNSRFVELQNVIVLDSIGDNRNNSCSQGISAFYNVSNDSGGIQHENTRIVGSMALNNAVENAMAWDDYNSIPNARLENSSIYDSGTGITTNGNRKELTVSNVTIDTGSGDGIARYGSNNTMNIERTIIYNRGGDALNGLTGTDVLCHSNGSSNGCTITNINPRANGLSYLTRIEDGSVLKTAGSGNSQIGATILNRIGIDGTYYGDINFDTEQDALWPWPYEERIYDDLCAARSSALCQAASLTDYIWGILGNPTPSSIRPMPKPTHVSIQKN